MAQISYPFNAILNDKLEPDKVYSAEHVAAERHLFLTNGVYPKPSTGLQVVSINNNMTIQVLTGNALIEGRTYINTEPINIAVNAAPASNVRKDAIAVRLDLTERDIFVVYKTGNVGTNPTPPPIIRNADIYELQLAEITVRSNTQSISQADILDTRLNSAVCGMVCGAVNQVDTTTLYRQYETYLNTKIAEWNATKAQQGTDWNNQMAQQTTNWNNQMTQQRNDWNAKESQQTTSWNNQMTQQRNGYTAQSTEIAAWYAAVKADITKLKSFNFDNIAELGGVEKKTTFNGNTSISELIKIKNSVKKVAIRETTFPANGNIIATTIIYKEDGATEMNRATVTTTFPADGSVMEVVS